MDVPPGPTAPRHVPVLPAEVLELLALAAGQTVVDATVGLGGLGGHTRLLAEAVGPTGRVLGLDQDAAMLELAWPRLIGLPVTLVQASFDDLPAVLRRLQWGPVDGVMADLGVCSAQLDAPERGLSFRHDGPLDMRLDPSRGPTAADLLRQVPERELANLIFAYAEERHSRRIARRIVERRPSVPTTTGELADLVRSCVPRSGNIDPATRVFQALRIAVNDELGALERLLAALPHCVAVGGRVALISFHSLEDRPVKRALKPPHWQPLTRKPVTAGAAEEGRNPRSRSAKLRAAVRLADTHPGAPA